MGKQSGNYYRTFSFVLVLLLSVITAQAEVPGSGAIKGKVVTADKKPVYGASIHVKNINRESVSEEDGTFVIENLQPGSYTLNVSFIGYSSAEQSVTVIQGQASVISIELKVTQQQLTEVTITTGHNRFNKKETDDVARLPLKNIENPQVYTIVTKEIMKEQQVTDYNSIFKNIPGAGVPVVYNQGRSAMLSRGFTTANLIRNSISGFVYTNIDPANLEVLEAVKGPSGTLFNSSQISFGGLFNRVTKKPNEYRRGEISYTAGSYNLNRLSFDINSPLNDDKTVLMRVNGALHTEQSFQDAGFTRSMMFAPSFVYKASDKLSFLLDVEASNFNATSPVRFAPARTGKVTNIKDLGMDYKRSFTNNSLDYVTQQLNVFGQINYRLSGQWKLQTFFTRTYSATKGYVTQLIGRTDSTLQQSVQKENFPYNGTEIQQNIVGDFRIGSMRNRLVAGIDFYNQRSDRTTPTITLPAINFKRPGEAYNYFNADKVDSAAAHSAYSIYRTNEYTYSAYVSNVIDITVRFKAMLSLRFDRFINKGTYYPGLDSTDGAFSQNALSPKLGLVYELVKDEVSLFANYMNGFNNIGGTDFNGVPFKPQQANQWEAGMKLDAFEHRLSSTISYYNIDVTNTTRDDLDHPGFNLQDGTQLSKGIEAEVIANPFGGLNIVAGYAYNNSKYTLSNKNVEGLRPATAGPAHLANLWISYRLMGGAAKGLGFGIGGNYGSSSFQTNTTTFAFSIPSYTVLDATVFYDKPTFRIGVKVDNLANEKYWSFRLAPQMPTRVTANITFRF
ncbi:TonB-dependent receptor [Foetidibacter luteolus]|uniref:TonB-dependent receptor n=1 Tax=Foetidibacter luteolus TaxID=2608880 RepID=UPI00129B702E|nr:TonB-dependent receptor [Foetidibacter luteolus]